MQEERNFRRSISLLPMRRTDSGEWNSNFPRDHDVLHFNLRHGSEKVAISGRFFLGGKRADLVLVLVARPSDSLGGDTSFHVGVSPADRLGVFGMPTDIVHELAAQIRDRREHPPGDQPN